MDPRMTPATPRTAHVSLRGKVQAETYTEGVTLRIAAPLVDLSLKPGGARERQLWLGEDFIVIDREGGHAFGFARKDGYCGWVPEKALADLRDPTHWVAAPAAFLYAEPRVQARVIATLPMGARVTVSSEWGKYGETPFGFVPLANLWPIGRWHIDPVSVAEQLLGTPYLWGGNSREGIDCSGLVQLAHHCCCIPLPGDSDLQELMGHEVEKPYQRGDLLFWKGHVAMAVGRSLLIHANGHSMNVGYEPINACIKRIKQNESLELRSHRRL